MCLCVSGQSNAMYAITRFMNLFYVLLDHFISACPFRVLHFWYTSLFSLFYGGFLAIYWHYGGTHPLHTDREYIYSNFNFKEYPGRSSVWVLNLTIVFYPMMHVAMYCYCLFTALIYFELRKCCGYKGCEMEKFHPHRGYEIKKDVMKQYASSCQVLQHSSSMATPEM